MLPSINFNPSFSNLSALRTLRGIPHPMQPIGGPPQQPVGMPPGLPSGPMPGPVPVMPGMPGMPTPGPAPPLSGAPMPGPVGTMPMPQGPQAMYPQNNLGNLQALSQILRPMRQA